MAQQQENGCLPGTNCFVTVPQDKWYAVEKFGKFDKVLGPGLSFISPDLCGCCIGFRSITSRVEQSICSIRTKTKDNVFVNVIVAVQQSVIPDHVESAMYKLTNVNAQIDSYVSDVVRSQVPKMTLDEAFEKKDDISDACQEQLQKCMSLYGFQIHKALVTELQPDREVSDAMNEINKQKRLRDAALMAAEAEKIRLVKQAEAAADAQHLQGQGIARQRAAIIDGLRDSITAGTGETLSSDKVSELLLITQYFETMRDIGAQSKAQTVFIPSGVGGVSEIASQIRNGVLQAAAAPTQANMR
jgi:regulator of protease activity HflC (stomatin/prohibitin superfamily)